ncbi:MAG: mRNA-capping enzyme subunit beta [Caeruleum heppii]|nr:MAG: mRNA-capping enzyme subunit beta [Caeruleum heppii]
MDLRSIINTDASAATSATPSRPDLVSHPSPHKQPPPGHGQRPYGSSYPDASHQSTRPQPPPIQPPSQLDLRSPGASSGYVSGQSPHQHTPSSSLNGGQYPFPNSASSQSPAHGSHAHPYRDPYASAPHSSSSTHRSFDQHSPSSHTPYATTPGTSYPPNQHYPPPSAHSSPTPTSVISGAPQNYRASPSSSTPYPYPPQHLHQAPHSQPGTPLGPPVGYARPSPVAQREPHSPYGHQRAPSSGSYGAPTYTHVESPQASGIGPMHRVMQSPSSHPLQESPYHDHHTVDRPTAENERPAQRERSISVSPKTVIHVQPGTSSVVTHDPGSHVNPAKRKFEEDDSRVNDESHRSFQASETATSMANRSEVGQPPLAQSSFGHPSQMHDIRRTESGGHVLPQPVGSNRPHVDMMDVDRRGGESISPVSHSAMAHHATSRPSSSGQGALGWTKRSPSTDTMPHHNDSSTRSSLSHAVSPSITSRSAPASNAQNYQAFQTVGGHATASAASSTRTQQPHKKRRRHEPPPIFAQSVIHRNGAGKSGVGKHRSKGVSGRADSTTSKPPPAPHVVPHNAVPNGTVSSSTVTHPPAPLAQTSPPVEGVLGAWEPSFTNVIPAEEITRIIADFLFIQVVQRSDVGASSVGNVPDQQAQIEIEAKLGHLIDKNTNDRLRVPVLTECVFNKDDPSFRTSFKSSMTESQHRSLNQYLNKAVAESRAPPAKLPPTAPSSSVAPKARIPMDYVHTRERDRFYELPNDALATLPLSIRPYLNQRHKVKVRVTTDQKTGQLLAKIVKVRIADMDIYSPRTAFDWRISVNLEMSYAGEVDGLIEVLEGGKKPDRSKDRMSYRHLAYQIDLTQVTMQSEENQRPEKEHELEIELSADKLKEQGLLAKSGQPSQYEDLVKGFVDNVRLLARAVGATPAR